jgi:polar amino acid transport system substrate-binding protein
VLTVGTELPAPPFWIGKDYNSLTGGFEVDLAREIGKRLGLNQVKFVEMPFTGLVAGQPCPCDINFSQVTITLERDKVVNFTEPYFDSNQGVLTRSGTKVANLQDAKALQWGAQLNTTGAIYIAGTIKPTKEARLFDRTVDAFAAFNAGQIDAVLLDTPTVLGAVEAKQVRNAEVVGEFKTGEAYGGVVNRDFKNLEAFNQVIRTLKSERIPGPVVQELLLRAGGRARDPRLIWARRQRWSSSSTPSSAGSTSKSASPPWWRGSRPTSR